MPILILGLVIFLGAHSIRIFADGWRTRMIARIGAKPWKAAFALVSLIGFVLIVVGFGQARHTPELLYLPPRALKDLNGLFTLVAFVLFGASHAPPTHYKAWLHHPMVAGAGLWAFGHLLATGFLHDVVLFGAFLAWAIVDFAAARRRDQHGVCAGHVAQRPDHLRDRPDRVGDFRVPAARAADRRAAVREPLNDRPGPARRAVTEPFGQSGVKSGLVCKTGRGRMKGRRSAT